MGRELLDMGMAVGNLNFNIFINKKSGATTPYRYVPPSKTAKPFSILLVLYA